LQAKGVYKRLIVLCLLVGIAVAVVFLLPKAAGAEEVVVTGDVVNLRSGPGTGYAVVGRVAKGQQLAVLERRGDWCRVRLSSGQVAWIAGWLVKTRAGSPTPGTGGGTLPAAVEVTGSYVNLRSGPGTGYARVGEASRGARLAVEGKSGEWYRVRLQSGSLAWIAGWLVKPVAEQQPPQRGADAGEAVVVTGDVVNLRSGPGTGYAVVGRVVKGQQLAVLERRGDWCRVRLSSGQVAWIAGWLVKKAAPVSRGDGETGGTPQPAGFLPRVFALPVRAALSTDAPAAAWSANGSYALVNGATGEVLFQLQEEDVFTVTVARAPGSSVGDAAYTMQVERNRLPFGVFTGPLVLAEGQGGKDNWFSLNVDGSFRRYRGNLTLRLHEGRLLLVNELPLEEYLYGVVPREMPAHWPIEALKAQAVAARSYAYYMLKYGSGQFYDVLSTQASQVYGGLDAESPRTTAAVDETRGLVLTEGGRVIPAYFHSSDGGWVENSEDVWREYVGVSRGKPDPYDRHPENPHYGWSVRFSVYDLAGCLATAEYDFSVVTEVYVVERTASGSSRIKRVEVVGFDRNGQPQRQLLGNADKVRKVFGLKSPPTELTKEYDPVTGELVAVIFAGNGWGHCLGMSQWGARAMAEQGMGFAAILNFYYGGATVGQIAGP
jgi:SpoIID/LytB domain protein